MRRRLPCVPFEKLTHDTGVRVCQYLTDKDYCCAAQASRSLADILLTSTARVEVRRRLSFATRLQIWSRTRYCIGRRVSFLRESR